MTQLRCYLSSPRDARANDSLSKALACVRRVLTEESFHVRGWTIRPETAAGEDDLLSGIRTWDLFVEAVGDRPELSFEAGFAVAHSVPVIVIKQQGSIEIPVMGSIRRVLRYPDDTGTQKSFDEFEGACRGTVQALKASSLTPGHRALRGSQAQLAEVIQGFLDRYAEEHPRLHLMSGWTRRLSEEMDFGRHALHQGTDPDYYKPMFSALRNWQGGEIRAIADLTDGIERFWRPEHPETMSARVTERIFLIDWRLFFSEESELTRYIERWRRHKENHRDRDYEIYIAIKDRRDDVRLPFGDRSAGHHMLLIEPDVVGGYVCDDQGKTRLVIAEDGRERLLYGTAEQFYNTVKDRAVRFDPSYGFLHLKRRW